jgi:hypothetical protein
MGKVPAFHVSLLLVVQVSPYPTVGKSSRNIKPAMNISLNLFISYPLLRLSVFTPHLGKKTTILSYNLTMIVCMSIKIVC